MKPNTTIETLVVSSSEDTSLPDTTLKKKKNLHYLQTLQLYSASIEMVSYFTSCLLKRNLYC